MDLDYSVHKICIPNDDADLSYTDDEGSQVYTEDEADVSVKSNSNVKPAPPIQNIQQETLFQKSDSSEIESSEDETDNSIYGETLMINPFGFGNNDPFVESRLNEISHEPQFIIPSSTLPVITAAKQRILVCCRDLGISEENEIRYPDLQKIYFKHFGTSLDKAELNTLFGAASASEVLKNDFSRFLKVKLARESEDKVMKLTAIGDIRESLFMVENDEIFGILKPIPELSPQDVEDVLKNNRRFLQISAATNLNQRISRRDVFDLRKKGFARENFFELPSIKNPLIKEEEDGSDEFTDDENILEPKTFVTLKPRRKFVIPADPNFGLRPSMRKPSSNKIGSTTSSMANTNLTSMKYRPSAHPPRPKPLPYEDESDVWSDGEEDFTPQFLYKEPYGEVYRDKLNITTHSFNRTTTNQQNELVSDDENMPFFNNQNQLPERTETISPTPVKETSTTESAGETTSKSTESAAESASTSEVAVATTSKAVFETNSTGESAGGTSSTTESVITTTNAATEMNENEQEFYDDFEQVPILDDDEIQSFDPIYNSYWNIAHSPPRNIIPVQSITDYNDEDDEDFFDDDEDGIEDSQDSYEHGYGYESEEEEESLDFVGKD